MPIYEIEAPDGRILEIEGDQFPSEQELDNIFASVGSDKQPLQPKGIDLTPSGMTRRLAAATVAPFYANKKNKGVAEAYKELRNIQETQIPKNLLEKGLDIGTTFLLPQAKVLQAGKLAPLINNLVTGAYQGGLIGGVQGLQEGKGLQGLASGAGIGGALTVGLPLVGNVVKKGLEILPQTGGLFAKTVGRVQPETLQRAVQPDSVALDLTRNEAQNLLMNTTEQVRNAYNEILAKRGQEVGEQAQKLRSKSDRIPVAELKKDVQDVFSQYKGDDINPAEILAGGMQNEINNIIESGTRTGKKEVQDLLNTRATKGRSVLNTEQQEEAFNILAEATKKPKSWLKTQLNSKSPTLAKNRENIENIIGNVTDELNDYPVQELKYYAPQGGNFDELGSGYNVARQAYDDIINRNFANKYDDLDMALNQADKEYYQLIKEVAENPNNQDVYKNAYDSIQNIVKGLPQEAQEQYFNQMVQDLDDIYYKTQTISPIDLQSAKQTIKHFSDWGEGVSKGLAKPIAERIYGKFNSRLSALSPELAQANKRFAQVANFDRNEGLKTVLNPKDNIGQASSVLKNYNSTVTKGNINRNVQDLENLLVNEGYNPFISNIDDVNAAMDLLNARATGDSWLANLATQLTRPALRATRGLNRAVQRTQIPQRIEAFKNSIGGLNRYTTPTLYGLPLTLQGGVVYNEDRY